MMNKNTIEFKKLKTFLTTPIKNGYSPVCTDVETSKTILSLGALTGQSIDLSKIKWVPEANKKTDNFLINPGDFLVSRSNTLDKVGRAALYRGGLNNCAYPDLIMKFRIDEAAILPDFLEVLLQSSLARKHFMQRASGTSNSMVKITKSAVESLPIPLLPLQTQKKIAEIAASWDKAIDKMKELIAAKEKQLEWLQTLLFSYTLKNNQSTYFLSDVCKIKTGKKDVNQENLDGIYPFFTCSQNHTYSDTYSYDMESILLAGNGNIGNPILFKGKFEAYQRTYILYDFKNVDPEYLVYFLKRNLKKKIIREKQEGAMSYIKLQTLQSLEILLPALSEQKSIAFKINLAQKEITLLEQVSEKYRQQKNGLMQKLLSPRKWQSIKTQLEPSQ